MTDLEMIDNSNEFVVRIGRLMFKNWHWYRYTKHCSARKASNIWHTWDRVWP